MKKLKQIFQNDSGKFTLRYIAGAVGFVLCGVAFVLGGFHFYDIPQGLFDSFLTATVSLIGLGVLSKFAKK